MFIDIDVSQQDIEAIIYYAISNDISAVSQKN